MIKKLNYEFKDTALLDLALTQSGVDSVNNNERLEFIGDRVLGLTVAKLLFDMFKIESEGELARRHAALVSTETLAQIAQGLELAERLRRGHMTGGKLQHVLANAMEAILGAVFIDGGFDAAAALITELWTPLAAAEKIAPKDPKTALQEIVQKSESGALPVYEYLESSGASHNPLFKVSVTALGKTVTASGMSKKAASVKAAEELLTIINN